MAHPSLIGAAQPGWRYAKMPTWSRGSLGMVLKDRVALVTGGGTGIGLAIILAFLREGARVAIGSRNPVHLKAGSEAARAAGHEILPLQLDVTDPASARSAVDAVMSRDGRISNIQLEEIGRAHV